MGQKFFSSEQPNRAIKMNNKIKKNVVVSLTPGLSSFLEVDCHKKIDFFTRIKLWPFSHLNRNKRPSHVYHYFWIQVHVNHTLN